MIAPPADLSWEELEAAGLCECGSPLDGHPPLAKPLPWNHGRPCAKTALDRGYGWDGRPAIEHTPAVVSRWSAARRPYGPSELAVDERDGRLTERQRELLRILAKHGGHQSAAAAELGIRPASVSAMLSRLRERGLA